MTGVLQTVLTLIETLLPRLGVGSAAADIIDAILNALVQLVPVVVQEAQDLVQPVKNIIAALSANPATTAAQLATLQALDKTCDDAFEAAALAAGAGPDPNASKS